MEGRKDSEAKTKPLSFSSKAGDKKQSSSHNLLALYVNHLARAFWQASNVQNFRTFTVLMVTCFLIL